MDLRNHSSQPKAKGSRQNDDVNVDMDGMDVFLCVCVPLLLFMHPQSSMLDGVEGQTESHAGFGSE